MNQFTKDHLRIFDSFSTKNETRIILALINSLSISAAPSLISHAANIETTHQEFVSEQLISGSETPSLPLQVVAETEAPNSPDQEQGLGIHTYTISVEDAQAIIDQLPESDRVDISQSYKAITFEVELQDHQDGTIGVQPINAPIVPELSFSENLRSAIGLAGYVEQAGGQATVSISMSADGKGAVAVNAMAKITASGTRTELNVVLPYAFLGEGTALFKAHQDTSLLPDSIFQAFRYTKEGSLVGENPTDFAQIFLNKENKKYLIDLADQFNYPDLKATLESTDNAFIVGEIVLIDNKSYLASVRLGDNKVYSFAKVISQLQTVDSGEITQATPAAPVEVSFKTNGDNTVNSDIVDAPETGVWDIKSENPVVLAQELQKNLDAHKYAIQIPGSGMILVLEDTTDEASSIPNKIRKTVVEQGFTPVDRDGLFLMQPELASKAYEQFLFPKIQANLASTKKIDMLDETTGVNNKFDLVNPQIQIIVVSPGDFYDRLRSQLGTLGDNADITAAVDSSRETSVQVGRTYNPHTNVLSVFISFPEATQMGYLTLNTAVVSGSLWATGSLPYQSVEKSSIPLKKQLTFACQPTDGNPTQHTPFIVAGSEEPLLIRRGCEYDYHDE